MLAWNPEPLQALSASDGGAIRLPLQTAQPNLSLPSLAAPKGRGWGAAFQALGALSVLGTLPQFARPL